MYYFLFRKIPGRKKTAELETIGGTGMVNFVQLFCPHDKKVNQNLTRELQSVTFGPHVEGEACRNKKTQKISL